MQDQTELAGFILAGTLAAVFFVVLIVLFVLNHRNKMHQNALELMALEQKQQQELFEAIALAEEKEKERIAKNLHDELSMNLVLLKQNLSRQKKMLETDSLALQVNEENAKLLERTIEGLSTSVYELTPRFMQLFGLSRSLQNDLERIHKSKQVSTKFSNPGGVEFENLYSKKELLNINRLCKELINNLLKHAGCKQLELQIIRNEPKLNIIIRHNGKIVSEEDMEGFAQNSEGLGLKSIKARIKILNGSISYSSKEGLAYTLLSLPLPEDPLKTTL